MEELTRELVRFCHALRSADLRPEVRERTKYLLLDYIGVAARGSEVDSSQSVYRVVAEEHAAGVCSVVGTDLRTSPAYAALANGTSAHSIELDDTHQAGSIHLGVVMFPVAIALSEALPDVNVSAEEFFCAVVAGYEVAARLGMAVQPRVHYAQGFHPTSTCGVFGAAVTASKLLHLSEEQMLSAVGIAGSMAAGSLEFLRDGAWTKRLHPGLAAQSGIQAAKLAAAGFRGPSTILEGRDGFLAAYSQDPRPELVTRDLGKTFEILRTSVKPHACCRYMQAPIDALLDMAGKHEVRMEDVARVEITVLEAGWSLVCEPRDRKYAPANSVDAQFSMPFGAAIALAFGKAGLEEFSPENFVSPRIRALMEKVVMTKDASLEVNFPEEWPARVKVIMHDGREFESYIRRPKGDPGNPLTWEELAAKFHGLAAPVFDQARRDEIENAVRGLGPGSDLRNLWKLLSRNAAN